MELIARPGHRSWYLHYRGTKLWLYICGSVVYQCGLIKEYTSPFQRALHTKRRAILPTISQLQFADLHEYVAALST